MSRPVDVHDPYAAFRVPDFRRLLPAWAASSIGGEIQAVAIGWELYKRTGSATVLGLVGLVQILPVYALALRALFPVTWGDLVLLAGGLRPG